jgi:hypothetical protein
MLVVCSPARGDADTEGVGWEGGLEERRDDGGSVVDAVHEALSSATTNKPARHVFDGRGNSSRPPDSNA